MLNVLIAQWRTELFSKIKRRSCFCMILLLYSLLIRIFLILFLWRWCPIFSSTFLEPLPPPSSSSTVWFFHLLLFLLASLVSLYLYANSIYFFCLWSMFSRLVFWGFPWSLCSLFYQIVYQEITSSYFDHGVMFRLCQCTYIFVSPYEVFQPSWNSSFFVSSGFDFLAYVFISRDLHIHIVALQDLLFDCSLLDSQFASYGFFRHSQTPYFVCAQSHVILLRKNVESSAIASRRTLSAKHYFKRNVVHHLS